MLAYREDVESDLSVFHRVDSLDEIDAPRFFAFAERLPAYRGAVLARYRIQQAEADTATPAAAPAATSPAQPPVAAGQDVEVVGNTRGELALHPVLGNLISIGRPSGGGAGG